MRLRTVFEVEGDIPVPAPLFGTPVQRHKIFDTQKPLLIWPLKALWQWPLLYPDQKEVERSPRLPLVEIILKTTNLFHNTLKVRLFTEKHLLLHIVVI